MTKSQQDSIRPFTINIPEAQLADLRQRIHATRWPDAETVNDQSQGVQTARIQALVRYWGNDYDWRKVEAQLNALPQFVTKIDGLDIHFLHVRSRHPNAKSPRAVISRPGNSRKFTPPSFAQRSRHSEVRGHVATNPSGLRRFPEDRRHDDRRQPLQLDQNREHIAIDISKSITVHSESLRRRGKTSRAGTSSPRTIGRSIPTSSASTPGAPARKRQSSSRAMCRFYRNRKAVAKVIEEASNDLAAC